MDPNANLAEQRRIVCYINEINDRCTADGQIQPSDRVAYEANGNRLAELVESLDAWITRGGFLPCDWSKGER